MNRKIEWYSGCHDEIELVYEKADGDNNIAALLEELETMALREAEELCGAFKVNGEPLTREEFLGMDERDRENMMFALSGVGLEEFIPSIDKSRITVTFSPQIQSVLGCTMFSVLNRLEKLDGAFNIICPKTTLELRVPLGAKKGMMKCEMLIMMLYPWLSVTETSSDKPSSPLNAPPAEKTPEPSTQKEPARKTPEKKVGLLSKLFGKKA